LYAFLQALFLDYLVKIVLGNIKTSQIIVDGWGEIDPVFHSRSIFMYDNSVVVYPYAFIFLFLQAHGVWVFFRF
jgi:hypothetical protein